MDLVISILSDSFSSAELHDMAYELCNTLNHEIVARAEMAEQPSSPGTKGDAGILGTIVLSLIGGGGVAVALVNVFKAYVERGSDIRIEVKNNNGETVIVRGNNVSVDEINRTAQLITKLIKAGK